MFGHNNCINSKIILTDLILILAIATFNHHSNYNNFKHMWNS